MYQLAVVRPTYDAYPGGNCLATKYDAGWRALACHPLFFSILLSMLFHTLLISSVTSLSTAHGNSLAQTSLRVEANLISAHSPAKDSAPSDVIQQAFADSAPASPAEPASMQDKHVEETPAIINISSEHPSKIPADLIPSDELGAIQMLDVNPPHFFTHKEFDLPPYPKGDAPEEPDELKNRLESGRLVIDVWIDNQGNFVQSEVVSSDLPAVFANVTEAMLKSTTYTPAKKQGKNVHSQIRMELNFAPPPEEKPKPRLSRIR